MRTVGLEIKAEKEAKTEKQKDKPSIAKEK